MILNEVEVQKLNLQPNEMLIIKIKSDEITTVDMESLATGMRSYFPNNKVVVLSVEAGGEIDLTTVAQNDKIEESNSGCAGNCNCNRGEN